MATILLQAAGAALGGLFGGIGGTIGMAAGSLAGYVIDKALINSTRTIEGPRLSSFQPLTAEEGTPVPRLYGTMRLGATIIWATRFEEERQTSRQGFKGGPKVTSYRYFANVGLALCEGEIAGVKRVWADGREVDLTTVEMRVHRGGDDQLPDPLIEAKQGNGNTPAYRGTAYVVFERLPLESYGNRVPQLQFEVTRPVSRLAKQVRAVALIPGATEYGLSPTPVTASPQEGETIVVNRHMLTAPSDFAASLDELQALCPDLESVALVISWFGDDLRAGHCRIMPGVTDHADKGYSVPWSVCGLSRAQALQVSRTSGAPAYGGTPTDTSVIAAIEELKARGLKVTLYPFVMMDIPAGNGLPDPYGAGEQAAYPWRGRLTADIAPGRAGTTDKTAQGRSGIAAFCGTAAAGDFAAVAGTAAYSGPAADFGYRRFVLHCANLAVASGGVDAFLIGSELRGLTTLRDENNAYPFVEALVALATEVKSMLGPDVAVTYGADWTEYFGHQPADGSGDVYFHLDPLWSHPAIDAIGIDNYMPLSDWRDGDWGGGNPDGAAGPADQSAMAAAITGAEGFDWYYAGNDRAARVRTPITDGAYGKSWVYRFKDIIGWWSNPHHDRPGGIESPAPTAWLPASKPVWFTELGCPAIDKGANQPNVFCDPKSAENAKPHFSDGGRNDLVPSRFLAAHMGHWDTSDPARDAALNPVSPVYGGPMVDPRRIYLWSWDARPYPAFPAMTGEWGDHANHATGHWLNGRLDGAPVGDLINAILADHRLPEADTNATDGFLSGYVVEQPWSARDAIGPLMETYGLTARDESGKLVFGSERSTLASRLSANDLVVADDAPTLQSSRDPDHDLPAELVFAFRDPLRDHQTAAVRVVEPGGRGRKQVASGLSASLDTTVAEALARDRMCRLWAGRDGAGFALPVAMREAVAGSAVHFDDGALPGDWLVEDIEEGMSRRLSVRAIDRQPPHAAIPHADGGMPFLSSLPGRPAALLLDLPFADAQAEPESRFMAAAWARPWRPQAVLASPEQTGYSPRARLDSPAVIGTLTAPLAAGPGGRMDHANHFVLQLAAGELASVSRLQMVNGANVAAVMASNGVWEIIQFEHAEEISDGVWKISGLLRGQGGTEDATAVGAPAGARFLLLDDAVRAAGLRAGEAGLALNWIIGPEHRLGAADVVSLTVVGGQRARLHLAPVHLRARRNPDGSIRLDWIRRGRFRADCWEVEDIPLDAAGEQYRVAVTLADGTTAAEAICATAQWDWPAAAVAAHFGSGPAEFTTEVRQASMENGPGLPATRAFLL